MQRRVQRLPPCGSLPSGKQRIANGKGRAFALPFFEEAAPGKVQVNLGKFLEIWLSIPLQHDIVKARKQGNKSLQEEWRMNNA
jgi:hypothetical protein